MFIKKITAFITIAFFLFQSFSVYATPLKSTVWMANVVIFAYFQDVEPERLEHFRTKETADELIRLFDGEGVVDFKGYINEISYGQLQIKNVFPQKKDDGTFDAIALPYTKDDTFEKQMDEDIIKYICENLPANSSDMDLNNDGALDSLNIVYIDDASSIYDYPTVWPHQYTIRGYSIYYNNLRVLATHVENTDRLYSMPGDVGLVEGAGLISHEFLHILGYPDLYAGYNNVSGYTPVGDVDIMAVANERLQWPLAYMRQHVSGWVNLPILTQTTNNVTVHLQSNREGTQGVIVKSPLNDYEFFVIEFRKDTDNFASPLQLDSGIRDSGLIIYRINTNVMGLSNFHGQTGVYVFRDPSPENANGFKVLDMFFSGDNVDTDQRSLGSNNMEDGILNGAITYNDGSNSGIIIDNISDSTGDSMTFNVTIPKEEDFDLWHNTNYIGAISSSQGTDIVDYNNTLYSLSAVDSVSNGLNNFNLYKYTDSNTWTKVSGFNDNDTIISSGAKLFVYNSNLHVAYSTLAPSEEYWLTRVKKYDSSENSWINVKTIDDNNTSGIFDLATSNDDIFISYIRGGLGSSIFAELKVARVSEDEITTVSIGNTNNVGQPVIAVVENKVFVSVADSKTVLTKEVFGSADSTIYNYEITADAFSYDVVAHEGNLYLAVENGGNIILSRLENNEWIKQAEKNGNYYNPSIQTSQGNLYVMVGQNIGDGFTRVYRFDNNESLNPSERLVQEGENVDNRSSNPKIVSIGSALYVSYMRESDSKAIIKEKITTNQLLAISIDKMPTKTNYSFGEAVDYTGLTINANYEQEVKSVTTGFQVSGFDTTLQGERYATVTYEGKTTTFPYFVRNSDEVREPYISGRINSYSNNSGISVKLYDVGDTSFENILYSTNISTAVTGNISSVDFAIGEIAAGSYNMVISRGSHLDYIVTGITMGSESIAFTDSSNNKINLINLIAGDVDKDGAVNFTDLSIIRNSNNFNKTPQTASNNLTDINGDGSVNASDLIIVLTNYNKTVKDSTISFS